MRSRVRTLLWRFEWWWRNDPRSNTSYWWNSRAQTMSQPDRSRTNDWRTRFEGAPEESNLAIKCIQLTGTHKPPHHVGAPQNLWDAAVCWRKKNTTHTSWTNPKNQKASSLFFDDSQNTWWSPIAAHCNLLLLMSYGLLQSVIVLLQREKWWWFEGRYKHIYIYIYIYIYTYIAKWICTKR